MQHLLPVGPAALRAFIGKRELLEFGGIYPAAIAGAPLLIVPDL